MNFFYSETETKVLHQWYSTVDYYFFDRVYNWITYFHFIPTNKNK